MPDNDLHSPIILLIGYGSDLRSDDGVGRQVAERVSQWQLPQVQSLSVHQLTPELSERLAATKAVIFVDASVLGLPEVTVTPLTPLDASFTLAHGCDPQSLLTLAQTLYGKSPPAWLVEIPVSDIRIGEDLSAIAQTGMATALDHIQALIQEILTKHSSPS